MNSFHEYQAAYRTTLFFPGEGEPLGIMYGALKLIGEAGEVADKVGKILRDHQSNFKDDEKAKEIVLELGDCLWYITAIAVQLGYSLEDVAKMNIKKLADRHARGTLSGSGDKR